VERLICLSSQGDLPAINAPQWIHLFQQKAATAKDTLALLLKKMLEQDVA
jgi:hypothetical protein